MRTMLRFTVAVAFLASAVPAFASGHGNDGLEPADQTSRPGSYTQTTIGSVVPEPTLGHGNDGGDLDVSPQPGEATRVAMGSPAQRDEQGRFIDRSQDAGG